MERSAPPSTVENLFYGASREGPPTPPHSVGRPASIGEYRLPSALNFRSSSWAPPLWVARQPLPPARRASLLTTFRTIEGGGGVLPSLVPPRFFPVEAGGGGTVRRMPPPVPVSALWRWGLLPRALRRAPPLLPVCVPLSAAYASLLSPRVPLPRRLRQCQPLRHGSLCLRGGRPPLLAGPA